MKTILGWTRQAHVTKGADPTEVVTWIHESGITITEFQNVYKLDNKELPEAVFGDIIAESLHRALELAYDHAQVEANFNDQGCNLCGQDLAAHGGDPQGECPVIKRQSINEILELLGIPHVEFQKAECKVLGLPPLE